MGLKQLPRELTAFEIEAFFRFTPAEHQVIEERRRPELKLGLALQMGYLRMSGRVLDAVAGVWRAFVGALQRGRRNRRVGVETTTGTNSECLV